MSPHWDEMVVVGRIARSHGRRGEVIVNPETDFPEQRFRPGSVVYLRRDGEVTPIALTSARFQGGRPVIGLQGVNSISEAEVLAGLELRVPAETLEPLQAGSYYRHDLVGCAVETGAGESVGRVSAVEGDAGSSRLVVATSGGEVLIPFAEEICPVVDVTNRRIVIDPPEGLLDVNRGGG